MLVYCIHLRKSGMNGWQSAEIHLICGDGFSTTWNHFSRGLQKKENYRRVSYPTASAVNTQFINFEKCNTHLIW